MKSPATAPPKLVVVSESGLGGDWYCKFVIGFGGREFGPKEFRFWATLDQMGHTNKL